MSASDAMAQLRLQRATGKREVKTKSYEKVYDEVDDGDYRAAARVRLLEDDFIENDDDSGYVDMGQDFWESREHSGLDEDERELKRSKKRNQPKKAAPAPAEPKPKPAQHPYKAPPAPRAEGDVDAFFDNVMAGLAVEEPAAPDLMENDSAESVSSEVGPHTSDAHALPMSDGNGVPFGDAHTVPLSDVTNTPLRSDMQVSLPSRSFDGADVSIDDLLDDGEFDDFNDSFWEAGDAEIPVLDEQAPVIPQLVFDDSKEKEQSTAPSPSDKGNSLHQVQRGIQSAALPRTPQKPMPPSMPMKATPSEKETSFHVAGVVDAPYESRDLAYKRPDTHNGLDMYWFDYTEHQNQIHMYGKIHTGAGKWATGSVTISGFKRVLYVAPRQKIMDEDESEQGSDAGSDAGAPMHGDVEEEIEEILGEHKPLAMEWVKKNYAFDVKSVPTGTNLDFLQVTLDRAVPRSVLDALRDKTNGGRSFAHIFGVDTNIFESLAVNQGIMGPCWLRFQGVFPASGRATWCDENFAYGVLAPENVQVIGDPANDKEPPLNVASLSLRTAVHSSSNKREIVAASLRLWNDADTDTLSETMSATAQMTWVRPLAGRLPPGTAKVPSTRSKGRNEKTMFVPTERNIVEQLLVQLQNVDMILVHGFVETLGVLVERLRTLNVPDWSKIGRLRRKADVKSHANASFVWRAVSGRLVVDLYGDFLRPLFDSSTGKLSDMALTTLNVEREEPDQNEAVLHLDPDHSTAADVDRFLASTEMDTQLIAALTNRVQAIPLTRLLTQLAGNSWQSTLEGHRSDRNDFVLLHEFHKCNFVVPDRPVYEGGRTKRGKPHYQGGLVLDPQRGLYDRCVIVLDFNSLYPSVIQEFNIDYTTVDRRSGYESKTASEGAAKEEEAHDADAAIVDADSQLVIPEVPEKDQPLGILPRLIHKFVSRRREVKGLLAKEKNESRIKLYNIKQNALKLTANTMYGCLGLSGSRFASVEMAALVTMKGRELLGLTREKALTRGLDVIYGDTDSLMINTNAADIATALAIGRDFKSSVNSLYSVLEIDIDALFLRMLLLQKKKYAALKVTNDKASPVETKMEIKGLDMVRREFCQLSKQASKEILSFILNASLSTEEVVASVHEYLEQLADAIRGGNVPIDDLVTLRALSRDMDEYNDKSIHHVQVALAMRDRGFNVRAGDVIPVVMCNGTGSSDSPVPRHPDDVRSGNATISQTYYLKVQVFQPVTRLCEYLQGTDKSRLADALGIAYNSAADRAAGDSHGVSIAAWQLSDAERFQDVDPLMLKCAHCRSPFEVLPLYKSPADPAASSFTPQGDIQCTHCLRAMSRTLAVKQIAAQIREHIDRLYAGWVVCSDATCGLRTNSLSVVPNQCTRPHCNSPVTLEYTESQLYTQLLYYASLFDLKKGLSSLDSQTRARWEAYGVRQPERPARVVSTFLEKSALHYVDMGRLFSFMR